MRSIRSTDIKRVLIIKLRHHGDVLLTSPVINQLKHHFPSAEVDALVYAETADMLRGLPSLSQLHLIKKNKKGSTARKIEAEVELVKSLKQRNFDLIIHLTESWRGAILCRLLKPKYSIVARYPHNKSRQSKLWRNSFTHHYPLPKRLRHTVDKHIDALRHIGLHPEKRSDLKLELTVNEQDRHYALELLQENNLSTGSYLLFHPTSRWLFKSWNETSAARLIDELILAGNKVLITSGPAEAELAMVDRVLEQCSQKPASVAGQTSLKQLAALIDYSALFIGVDSVPMHMAAAFQKPTVALFGPSGDKEWGPWQTRCKVLVSDVPCRPCGMDGCAGSKKSDCLEMITPESVLNAISELQNDQDSRPQDLLDTTTL